MYDWMRFWCPIGESGSLADNGFLSDPESEHGDILNPNAHAFESLIGQKCLVLLGEPGIGKSTAIEQHATLVRKSCDEAGDPFVYLDLAEYGNETRLLEDSFNSSTLQEWQSRETILHLFLDSLDECRLQIPHVAKILKERLKRLGESVQQMRLRICCRTLDWPAMLTDQFKEYWGDSEVGVYELLPLRKKDVLHAAAVEGIDADTFTTRVVQAGAQAFAIKPVTLNLLLQIFKESGDLPPTRHELYGKGCLLLCEETNPSRQSAGQVGRYSASDRLRAAEAIAAALVFCNKAAINMSTIPQGNLADDMGIGELPHIIHQYRNDIPEDLVREAISTGLFSGRGHDRIGFAHRTNAEFLAACYLHGAQISTKERLKFIQNADDSRGRVIPQLRETAAWLASLNEEVLNSLATADPQVMLRSDEAILSDGRRFELVDTLVKLAARGELHSSDWSDRDHYRKLNHPQLAEQLTPVLLEKTLPYDARHFAIDLVRECQLRTLQSELAGIVLDAVDDYDLRFSAAYAVMAVGDEETRMRLKPFVLMDQPSDPEFKIKTALLRTFWPSSITAGELFATLQPPNETTYDSYGIFVGHELAETLADDDMPHALSWLRTLNRAESHEYWIRKLVEEVAARAWHNLHKPDVLEPFVEYSLQRLQLHEDILPKLPDGFETDESTRRILAEAIVPRITDYDRQGLGLIFWAPRLLRESDIFWMLDRLEKEDNNEVAQHWARLVERLFDPAVPNLVDRVIELCAVKAVLNTEFAPRLAAIQIDSDQARAMRENYQRMVAWQSRDQVSDNPPPLEPPPAVRIEQALSLCESGNTDAWFDAARDLELEPTSRHYKHDFETDLTKLPGWQVSNESTRDRIISGAYHFLLNGDPRQDWLGTTQTPYYALWGYKGLYLLKKEAPEIFDELPADVWNTWSPIVVSFHHNPGDDDNKHIHTQIAVTCCSKSPDKASECLTTVFQRFSREDGLFVIPEFIDRCWNATVHEALRVAAANPGIRAAVVGALLGILLKHESEEGREIAIDLLNALRDDATESEEKRTLAAIALLRKTGDASWATVWPLIRQNVEFGRSVMLRVADMDMFDPSIATKIAEHDVAELFIWLHQQFPPSADHRRGGIVSSREAMNHYRDGTLRVLQHRGTPAAIVALRYIRQELPDLEYMPRIIMAAEAEMYRKQWKPLIPAELFAATQHTNTRLVTSAADLQDVILESLASLQERLQGETPAAPFLWDEISKDVFRPKDENHFSDFIKQHLEQDLNGRAIVSLREPQIRRGEGAGVGERTDIHITGQVQGITPGTFDEVRVIIEVKGSWNTEVNSAMETQLVDRYLRDNTCRHGVYIVGWFHCMQWDKEDSRYKSSRKEEATTLLERLSKQAAGIDQSKGLIKAFVLNCALR